MESNVPDPDTVDSEFADYSDFLDACRVGDVEKVNQLLTEEISVKLQMRRRIVGTNSVCDANGYGPLHLAAIGGHLKVWVNTV